MSKWAMVRKAREDEIINTKNVIIRKCRKFNWITQISAQKAIKKIEYLMYQERAKILWDRKLVWANKKIVQKFRWFLKRFGSTKTRVGKDMRRLLPLVVEIINNTATPAR
jgi:hypothetical protein